LFEALIDFMQSSNQNAEGKTLDYNDMLTILNILESGSMNDEVRANLSDKKKIKDLQPGFLTKTDPVNNVVGTFAPNGGTPLYDAFGRLIEHAAAQKSSTEAVNIFVFSDGEENDSKTFDEARLKDLIAEKKQENGWRFGFLGANQDAKAFADKFGLGADSAQNLTYDADGFKTGWQTVTQSVTQSISQPNNIDGAFSQGAYGKRGAGSLSNNLGSIPSSSRY